LRRLRRTTPVIRVTGPPTEDETVTVVADNPAVGGMGAHYLADLGLKYLAFVPTTGSYSDYRAVGFAEACRKRGIDHDVLTVGQTDDPRRLAAAVRRMPDPVGIMVATDRKALEVSRACRLIGKRIPEQVALLGVDDETEIC